MMLDKHRPQLLAELERLHQQGRSQGAGEYTIPDRTLQAIIQQLQGDHEKIQELYALLVVVPNYLQPVKDPQAF